MTQPDFLTFTHSKNFTLVDSATSTSLSTSPFSTISQIHGISFKDGEPKRHPKVLCVEPKRHPKVLVVERTDTKLSSTERENKEEQEVVEVSHMDARG